MRRAGTCPIRQCQASNDIPTFIVDSMFAVADASGGMREKRCSVRQLDVPQKVAWQDATLDGAARPPPISSLTAADAHRIDESFTWPIRIVRACRRSRKSYVKSIGCDFQEQTFWPALRPRASLVIHRVSLATRDGWVRYGASNSTSRGDCGRQGHGAGRG